MVTRIKGRITQDEFAWYFNNNVSPLYYRKCIGATNENLNCRRGVLRVNNTVVLLLIIFCLFVLIIFSCLFSHLTAEESDSDSDEDLEGGVRHDLMMADEKVTLRNNIILPERCFFFLLVKEHCDVWKIASCCAYPETNTIIFHFWWHSNCFVRKLFYFLILGQIFFKHRGS